MPTILTYAEKKNWPNVRKIAQQKLYFSPVTYGQALLLAVRYGPYADGSYEAAHALLDADANPSCITLTTDNLSPREIELQNLWGTNFSTLHWAVSHKTPSLEWIENLIKKGADLGALTSNQLTPIELAAHSKRWEIVALIAKTRARPQSAEDNFHYDKVFWETARERNYSESVGALRDANLYKLAKHEEGRCIAVRALEDAGARSTQAQTGIGSYYIKLWFAKVELEVEKAKRGYSLPPAPSIFATTRPPQAATNLPLAPVQLQAVKPVTEPQLEAANLVTAEPPQLEAANLVTGEPPQLQAANLPTGSAPSIAAKNLQPEATVQKNIFQEIYSNLITSENSEGDLANFIVLLRAIDKKEGKIHVSFFAEPSKLSTSQKEAATLFNPSQSTYKKVIALPPLEHLSLLSDFTAQLSYTALTSASINILQACEPFENEDDNPTSRNDSRFLPS